MAISKEDIRDLVKRRLGLPLTETKYDDLIDLYIDTVEESILNFCNISAVPNGLKQTWAAIAASALSAEQLAVLFPDSTSEEAFEIKIGDTTVKPVKPVVSTAPPMPGLKVIESVVFDYQSSLVAFRKLRW